MDFHLNNQQSKVCEEAINWFKYSDVQVFEIGGGAGTGKTYLTFAIINALGLSQSDLVVAAYTGAAALVLKNKGFINACTIHSTLYEISTEPDYNDIDEQFHIPKLKKKFIKKYSLPENIKLIIIDEGYMVPMNMYKDILSFGIKILVTGDPNQLPPIAGEPAFLTNPSKIHMLTELMRQAESDPIVYLANRALADAPIHCGMYGNNVMVINDDELIPQMFGYADVVLTGFNQTRDAINNYVRTMLGFDKHGPLPVAGERLICRENNWDIETPEHIPLVNGLTGNILNSVDVINTTQNFSSKVFMMDFLPDRASYPFLNLLINYDYFIADHKRRNEIKSLDRNSKFLQGEYFEFAYALTTHLSQGSEYEKGILIEETLRPQERRQLIYTGITRFKKSLIYVRKRNKYIYIPENPL